MLPFRLGVKLLVKGSIVRGWIETVLSGMVTGRVNLEDTMGRVAVVTDTGIMMQGIEERSGSAEMYYFWNQRCRNVPSILLYGQQATICNFDRESCCLEIHMSSTSLEISRAHQSRVQVLVRSRVARYVLCWLEGLLGLDL